MIDAVVLGRTVDLWARRLVLALTLALSCIFGLITPYLLGVIGIALFVALALKGQLVAAYTGLAAQMFLAAFAVLAVCFALTAQEPSDALSVFNFTMLVYVLPAFIAGDFMFYMRYARHCFCLNPLPAQQQVIGHELIRVQMRFPNGRCVRQKSGGGLTTGRMFTNAQSFPCI